MIEKIGIPELLKGAQLKSFKSKDVSRLGSL